MKPRGRDVRLFGVAIAIGITMLVGTGLALLPGGASPAPPSVHAKDVDVAFRQGVAMLHARQYEYAVTAFHRVLKFAPGLPEAHANMGFALVGLGRHREARDFFEGALGLRPGQLNAYYGLALASEAMGDREAARGAMRTYAHLAPESDPFRRKAEAALWEWSSEGGGARRPSPSHGMSASRP